MVAAKKLRGTITLQKDHSLRFNGSLYDKTPFELNVDPFDIQLTEEFMPSKTTVMGYLFVQQEAQQGDICYLTLPKPNIKFGRQITVNSIYLMDRHVTIEAFRPTKKTPPNKSSQPAEETV